MSQPAKRFNPSYLSHALKQQSWVVFSIVLIGLVLEIVLIQIGLIKVTGFAMTKNLLAGSVLAWFGQLTFAKIALSVSGYQQRQQVVHRFYLAQMVKWLISLVGFALIFIILKPLNAPWVILGFLLVQLSHVVLMLRSDSKH